MITALRSLSISPPFSVSLHDVTVDQTGTRNPADLPDEKFDYIDISSIDNAEKQIVAVRTLFGRDAPSRARKIVRAGDVLVSTVRPNLNAVAVVPESLNGAICSTGYCVLRANDRLLADYLFYFVQSQHFLRAILGQVSGAMYPATTDSKIRAVEMPVSPLHEQRRIVDILKRADGIRRLHKQAVQIARKLIPALFVDLFGDPATNPKRWPIVPLKSVAKVESGAGFPIGYQGITDQEFPFFKVGDMNAAENQIEMRVHQHSISNEVRQKLRAKAFPASSIIFPKIGAAIATNKKRMLTRPSCADNNVMAIIPGERLNVWYFYHLFHFKHLSSFASDSNPPSIRKTTVEEWGIPVPPPVVQQRFVSLAADIMSVIGRQRDATLLEDNLIRSLIHRAFRGEL